VSVDLDAAQTVTFQTRDGQGVIIVCDWVAKSDTQSHTMM